MIVYKDARIRRGLENGDVSYYVFLKIELLEEGFESLRFTDYASNYYIDFELYIASVFKEVEIAPRTGQLGQEVQKLQLAQGLSSRFEDTEFDIIKRLGNKFHNAPVTLTTYMQVGDELLIDEPVFRSEGLVKSIARSVENNEVIIEFTNAFGRLDFTRDLRTSTGSLQRFDPSDTSFDRATDEVSNRVLEWGVDG